MARFYFFTDATKLTAQTAAQAFGPDSTNPLTKYRTTSLHSGTEARAYAVCDGDVVLVDNVVDAISGTPLPNLINIILRPSEQPELNLGYIKYYVYRSVRLDSVIDTTPSTPIIRAYSSSSVTANIDLLKRIYDNYQLLLAIPNNTYPADPEASLFMANSSQAGATPLYKSFFKTGGSQYQHVKAGECLGIFQNSEFGFEVVYETTDFEPDLDFARKTQTIVTASALVASPQAARFQSNNEREAILRFLDPCAFFGSFYDSKLKLKHTDTTTGNVTESNCSGDEIYQKILNGLSNNHYFANRNVTYLDIRNEFNQSFDYFENYSQGGSREIFLTLNGTSEPSPTNYYSGDWPVKTISVADFAAGDPANSSADNVILINLPRGNNFSPFIFVDKGDASVSGTLKDRLKKKSRFISLYQFNDPALTTPVAFTSAKYNSQEAVKIKVPNYQGNSTTEPICSLIRMHYLRLIQVLPEPVSSGMVICRQNMLDNLFMPLGMNIPFEQSSPPVSRSYVYHQPVFVDAVLFHIQAYMARPGIHEDENNNITLFTFATEKDIDNKPTKGRQLPLLGRSRKAAAGNQLNDIIQGTDNIRFTSVELVNEPVDNTGQLPKLHIIGQESSSYFSSYVSHNADDFNWIRFSKDEFNWIKLTANAAGFLPGFPVYLRRKRNGTGEQEYSSPVSTDKFTLQYIKYEVMLTGYSTDTSGNISVLEVPVPWYDSGNLPISGTQVYTYQLISNKLIVGPTVNSQPTLKMFAPKKDSDLPVDRDINNIPIPSFKKKERGFWIESQSTGLTTTYTIHSTIYLVSSTFFSEANFQIFTKYIAENIQQCWDSSTNKGLPTNLGSFFTNVSTNSPVKTSPLNSGIIIKTITGIEQPSGAIHDPVTNTPITNATIVIVPNPIESRLRELKKGEIVLLCEHILEGVSYIITEANGNRRRGRLVFDPRNKPEHTNPYPYVPWIENVPAHEFGHVLGLADKYVHYCGLRKDNLFINPRFTAKGNPGSDIMSWVDPLFDPEYGTWYRWRHNLMSSNQTVRPAGYVEPIRTGSSPASFVNDGIYFYESNGVATSYDSVINANNYRPETTLNGTVEYHPPAYTKQTLFLTEKQFSTIIDFGNGDAPEEIRYKNFSNDERENFPKRYTFILKHNPAHPSQFENMTAARLDFMGAKYAANGNSTFITDYNSDDYPTNRQPWEGDPQPTPTSVLIPGSIDYDSFQEGRMNNQITAKGWLKETEEMQLELGDVSTQTLRTNIAIGGELNPGWARRFVTPVVTPGSTTIPMITEWEGIQAVHQYMLMLAQADLILNPRDTNCALVATNPNQYVDTLDNLRSPLIASLMFTRQDISRIATAANLFESKYNNGNGQNRTFNRTKREFKNTVYDHDKANFSDLNVPSSDTGLKGGQTVWNQQGSYYEGTTANPGDGEDPSLQWRLRNSLSIAGAGCNVAIHLRATKSSGIPNGNDSFDENSDVLITYKIVTRYRYSTIDPFATLFNNLGGSYNTIGLVTFTLKYTEFKNRELIMQLLDIGR